MVEGILKVTAVLGLIIGTGVALDWVSLLPHFPSGPFVVPGVALLLAGTALEAYSTSILWALGNGTPNPESPPDRLVTQGIYARSRNPLYVARLTILAGAAAVLQSSGVALLTVLLYVCIEFVLLPREERRLASRYGERYRAYCQRTPRWLSLRSRRSDVNEESSGPSARSPER